MTTISGHTTRANGTILTAAIYNFDHVNHINNATSLNADKVEGATPPVVDGHAVVFDGTDGRGIRTSGGAPLVGSFPLGQAQGGTGEVTLAAAFNAMKVAASETVTGVVEKATVAEFRAATPDKYVATDLIETASAGVALTDAANVTVDWDSFINATLIITANRVLSAPTNAQPGTWRTIRVSGSSSTPRTLTFDAQYRGGSAAPADITNAKEYLITLFAITSTICILKITQALP